MFSVDIIEQKRYSFSDLSNLFRYGDEDTKVILRRLKEYGVLKSVKSSLEQKDLSDLNEYDIENVSVDSKNQFYVFTYVGILIVSNIVLRCYPKYYLKNNNVSFKDLKQIIKIIEKYNSDEQIIYMQNEINDSSAFNMLSVMIYFIDDYYKNGLYSNYQNIVEMNGTGEILWDKTINETYALINNNRPYYTEMYTKKTVQNDSDYFKLLHESILTSCSKNLENAGILELFDLSPINLNNQNLSDFGEIEYILYKINQELNVQFNSHKQSLLKAMYSYISQSNSYVGDLNYFSMYGTTSYNLVWEKMCSSVIGDLKDEPLGTLNLPTNLNDKYNKLDTLLSIIEKPNWVLFDKKYEKSKQYIKTLEPDSITFYKTEDSWEFFIFDAKYYILEDNRPGVDSIIKQHLYELSYKEFVNLHSFSNIKNCFLFPTYEDEIIIEGHVKLEILHDLKEIQVRLLPVKLINEFYLNNKKLDLSKLEL